MKSLREMLRGMDEIAIYNAFGRFMAHAFRRGRDGAPPIVHFARGGALWMAACEGYAQRRREMKFGRAAQEGER